MIRRNLDGVYFRINGANICFSDLTEEQRNSVMQNKDADWLKAMCNILANVIAEIGEKFDIVRK